MKFSYKDMLAAFFSLCFTCLFIVVSKVKIICKVHV